jgi:hypothetical protein
MSGKDRRPHESATVLDQTLLDFSQDNLDNRLQMIVEIERPQAEEQRHSCSFTVGSPGVVYSKYNPFIEFQAIIFETSGSLPPELTAGQTYYVRNPYDGNFEVSATILGATIDFSSSGSGSSSASHQSGLIRVSDRNIFVGARFYEARTIIPVVQRTVGEWLRPTIEFGSLQLELNNVDKRYSGMLPGGDNYSGQINKRVQIKLGLRDVESTYFTIFDGYVTETGGFKRNISAVRYVSRDRFDRLNVKFPPDTFKLADYPKISDTVLGLSKPVIYGDYSTDVETEGNIPAQTVNGRDPQAYFEKELPVSITNGTPGIIGLENHLFDDDDKIRFSTDGTLPSPLSTGTDYYVIVVSSDEFAVASTPGGAAIATSGGSGSHNVTAQDLVNIQCVIAGHDLKAFDSSEVWLSRAEVFYRISSSDVVNVAVNNASFEIAQNTGNTLIDGNNYTYESSDVFLVKITGHDLGAYDGNMVWQARHMLETYASIDPSEFNSNWTTYRDKASPSQSAIASIPARAWLQEQQSVLEYSLSMLEQVRLEYFISRDLDIKINSLHLEDLDPDPAPRLRNFDVVEGSVSVSIDERNNFNRAQGFHDFNPFLGENYKKTGIFRNQAAIDQSGKEMFKSVEFPNIVARSDAEAQISEILRIASAETEILTLSSTARHLLRDIGDFFKVSIEIDSTVYDNVPMMIREIGYGSDLKLPLKLWSFQMVPFANPGGWNPGYSGTTAGDSASITEEEHGGNTMAVSITVSETMGGAAYADSLAGGDTGIDFGQTSNGAYTPLVDQPTNEGAQQIWIRHDATVDPITSCAVFVQQYSGTYGGADSAANDYTNLKNMGYASAGSTANNSNGDWQGLAVDMDWDVTQANQFDPSRIGSGGGAGSNVFIFGDGTASPTDGIDLSSAFDLKAAAMVYDNTGTPTAPTAAVDGQIGKSGDTALGDNCKLLGRFYLNTGATTGGIMQWDMTFSYSHTA